MGEAIRVGVIGTGFGVTHIEALQQIADVTVTAVCSAQRERAERVVARYGIPFATDEYRELLREPVDAVVIATPPALHEPMALAALAAGKHLLCEKPLAATLEQARAMRDAAEAAGVVHMVNHHTRQSPPLVRATELIAAGYLGRATVADFEFRYHPGDYLRSLEGSDSKAGWYTDAGQMGGLFFSAAGPHLIDAIQALLGPIVAVAAQFVVTQEAQQLRDGTTAAGITAEDGFLVLARFANGVQGTIRGIPLPYHDYNYTAELHGTAGSLVVRPRTLHGATASDPAPAPLALPESPSSQQVALTGCFIAAVRAGGPAPAPNFDDGVATQAVMAACAESARTGRWVSVAA